MFSTAILTTLLALVLLWQLRIVVIYVLVSLALAATIRPLIKRLSERPLLIRVAWVLLYIIILGSLGLLLFLTGKSAVTEIQLLGQNLSTYNTWILPKWLEGTTFQQTLVSWLPAPNQLFKAVTGDQGQLVLPAFLSIAENLGSGITGGIVILFLSIYWSINQVHFERLWLSLLEPGQRTKARGIWRKIEPEIGAYIRSQLIHSLLAGLLLGLGFWLIGSPYPALLAFVCVLGCLIPIAGKPLSVILVLIIGLSSSVQLGLLTGCYVLVILIVIQIFVEPKLFKSVWKNHILTLVLVITLVDALGIIGIIVAPILSIICQILWNRLVSHPAVVGAAEEISDLKERQKRLWKKINAMPLPHLPLVTSSIEQLDALLLKAEPILQADFTAKSADRTSHPGQEEDSPDTPAS
jgi:putative permease